MFKERQKKEATLPTPKTSRDRIYNPSLFRYEEEDLIKTEDIDIRVDENKDRSVELPIKEKRLDNFVPKNKVIKKVKKSLR